MGTGFWDAGVVSIHLAFPPFMCENTKVKRALFPDMLAATGLVMVLNIKKSMGVGGRGCGRSSTGSAWLDWPGPWEFFRLCTIKHG